MTTQTPVRTYRGRSLEEILPQIRTELGPDAVITCQRDGLFGGVGGFFQKRCVEVEAQAGDTAERVVETVVADDPEPLDLETLLGGTYTRTGEPQRFDLVLQAAAEEAAAAPAAPAEEPFAPMTVEELGAVAPAPAAPAPVAPAAPAPVAPAPAPAPVAFVPAAPVAQAPVIVAGHQHVAPLVHRGFDPHLAAQVADEAAAHIAPLNPHWSPADCVRAALQRRIAVHAAWGSGHRAVAFAGAPGSGKSTCAARLALAYAAAGVPVTCVALRPADQGAALYAQLAGSTVALVVAHRPEDVPAGAHHGMLVVDTPGHGAYDAPAAALTASDLHALGVREVHVTLAATTGAGAAREALAAAAALRPVALALTHVDATAQWGPGITAALEHGLPLSYLSHHPGAPVALRAADPAALAAALLA